MIRRKINALSINACYEGQELTLNAFRSGIFPTIATQRKGCLSDLTHVAEVSGHLSLKILTPTQALRRLPIALTQLKADNISENLLHEICQIIYSLHQAKEITKNSIKYNKLNKVIKQNGYYIYEF